MRLIVLQSASCSLESLNGVADKVLIYSQKDSPVEERVNELKSQPPSDSSSSHADETSTPPSSDGLGEQQEEEDKTKKADRIKEEGNVSFKAKKYDEAIDLYTKAIGAFLTMFFDGEALC